MTKDTDIISKMEILADEWEKKNDNRAIFLRCYSMMTDGMMKAIADKRFQDNPWVEQLLHRFADYYFDALACFDCGEEVPLVWLEVHDAATHKKLHVLQHLILGINAHINYDLVLTLFDLLQHEWRHLPQDIRRMRYEDHCMVNQIISETIDRVQDEVVEDYAPSMDLVDRLMGRLDEKLLSRLIRKWRADVWENTQAMLQCSDHEEREQAVKHLEKTVLKYAHWIAWEI